MIEECKLCKEEQTPWEYVSEINGHICCECSYVMASYQTHFDIYKESIKNIRFTGLDSPLDYKKRVTTLLNNRWSKREDK